MALNAGVTVIQSTDRILQIIQRECTNATEWWRRECEGQQRYIKMLSERSLRVETEKDKALAEANKAKEEAGRYKAELDQYKATKAAEGPDWKAEAQRYKAEAHSWKSRYEVAVRGWDDTQQQLFRTQARFSLTVVPLNPMEPLASKKRPALVTPAKSDRIKVAETPSSNGTETPSSVFSSSLKRKRHQTSIMHPTAAAAAAAAGDPAPNEGNESSANRTSKVKSLTSGSQRGVGTSDTLVGKNTTETPSTTASRSTPPASSSPSTNHPTTPGGSEKWCYCDSREYGKMVMCSNLTCPKQWFHIPCTGLKQIPKGDWLCTYCTTSPSQSPISPDINMIDSNVP